MKAVIFALVLLLHPAPLLATVNPTAILQADVLDMKSSTCDRGVVFFRGVVKIDETYYSIWFAPSNGLALFVEHRLDGSAVEAAYGSLTVPEKGVPVFVETVRLRGRALKERYPDPCDWLAGKQA